MKNNLRTVLLYVVSLSLLSCSALPIVDKKVASADHRIQLLVMHHRKTNPDKSLPQQGINGLTSAHYVLPKPDGDNFTDTNLSIFQLVDEGEVALQTQNSYWQDHTHLDDVSIGVEMVNVPECQSIQVEGTAPITHLSADTICHYPDFDPQQIELLIALSKDILKRNPTIGPTQIVGHSDVAISLNSEPGPRFPWYQLYKEGIGAWYDNATVEKYWQLFKPQKPNIGLIQQALANYGYRVAETGIHDAQSRRIVSAFQAHFLPWQVTGNIDEQTAAVLFALVERYFPEKSMLLLKRYHAEQESSLVSEPAKIIRGQVDRKFPDVDRSSRELVNDRALFKAYQGRGEIIIENIDATSADIFINGQKLNITKQMQTGKNYQYSLKRRTKNGVNTLRVANVLPENASVNVVIPYPTIDINRQANSVDFSAVDQLINNDVAQGFPGAVLVVLKDGKIIKHSAYGAARKFSDGGELLSTPVAMNNNTLFDIASNTKMFATNFALMKLVSEGKLDVNLPINYYLADYDGDDRETRLVRDFLTHQAGYSSQVRFFTRENNFGEQFFSQNKQRTEQLILEQVPFSFGRNVKQVYSDTDYMLLGMLIERITGKALDAYVEQNIYASLSLKDTKFNPLLKGYPQADIAATEIHGNTRGGRVDFDNVRNYVLQGEVHDEKAFHSFNGVAGHAGLFSTTADLAVLMQVLLNDGGYGNVQLFDPKTVDQFTKPGTGNGTFGLGWRRAYHGDLKWHFGPYASASAYGHTGWTGTVTVIDPEHDLAIALLTNARHSVIEKTSEGVKFKGKTFETGNYGSIMALIYEALLTQ